MAFVYILQSKKTERYYIGSTVDVTRRLTEHNNGQTPSTIHGRPWACVFIQVFETIKQARRVELRLKSWKNRKLLERIISDGYLRIC